MFDRRVWQQEYDLRRRTAHNAARKAHRKSNLGLYAAYQAEYRRAHPERCSWQNLRTRCNNPNSTYYRNYGGRGVKVVYSSFAEFLLDVGNRPSPLHSIDRIDPNGDYAPGNCRWATRTEQNRNRRVCH